MIAEMLKEAGVTHTDPVEDARIERAQLERDAEKLRITMPPICCNEYVTGYTGDMQPVCFICGIVVNSVTLTSSAEPVHRDVNSTDKLYGYQRKRFYQPLTHFRDLLRRYQGAGDVTSVDNIKSLIGPVDLNDPWLYYAIKSKLKALKMQRFYKSIYQIIYILGGKMLEVTHTEFEALLSKYSYFAYYCSMNRDTADRKSMPSVYMVMDLLLRHTGHHTYYQLPILQDIQLRSRVYKLYTEFVKYAVANNSGHFTKCGSEPTEIVMQRQHGLPVLHPGLAGRNSVKTSVAPYHSKNKSK